MLTCTVCDVQMQEKCDNWDMAACVKKFQDSNSSGLESKKSSSTKVGNVEFVLGKKYDYLQVIPGDISNEYIVHARHACNGCTVTPIIGTRYHSTKLPNFDLCETCFTKYDGDKLSFTPEIQGMWPFYLWVKCCLPLVIDANLSSLNHLVIFSSRSPYAGEVQELGSIGNSRQHYEPDCESEEVPGF